MIKLSEQQKEIREVQRHIESQALATCHHYIDYNLMVARFTVSCTVDEIARIADSVRSQFGFASLTVDVGTQSIVIPVTF